ncbi:MAG: type II toxin-antitoxin system RelE/ParE family toxin [Chloroflexi bacterium]|nr:MAG: type II toxin-antitoxin system RelE/ParE family toxin [Chloroflexota bacterium]
MSYSVRFSKAIQRQIARLPGHVRNQAKQRILELRNQPRPSDAKELDEHPGYFRIWLQGDYRLVWYVDDPVQLVDIYYVGLKYDELYTDLGLSRPN